MRLLLLALVLSCGRHGSIEDQAAAWGHTHSPAPLIHVTCSTPAQASSSCTVYYQHLDPVEIICTRLRCKQP